MILPFKPVSPVKIICPSSDIVAILWAKESAFISTLTGVICVILSPPGLARVCTAWLASWWGTPGWIYKYNTVCTYFGMQCIHISLTYNFSHISPDLL